MTCACPRRADGSVILDLALETDCPDHGACPGCGGVRDEPSIRWCANCRRVGAHTLETVMRGHV